MNNWANHENLDLPRFFKWINQTKKNVLKIISYFAMLFRFSLNVIVSQRTLHLALDLDGKHSSVASLKCVFFLSKQKRFYTYAFEISKF